MKRAQKIGHLLACLGQKVKFGQPNLKVKLLFSTPGSNFWGRFEIEADGYNLPTTLARGAQRCPLT